MKGLLVLLSALVAMLVGVAGALATTDVLTPGPDGRAHWVAGPDSGTQVLGSSGRAKFNNNGVTFKIRATGLVPGHAYTMWVAYWNDGNTCTFGHPVPLSKCGPFDAVVGRGGIAYGDGKVAGGSGTATFTARINIGDESDLFGVAYQPSETPNFSVIVRSKGPRIAASSGQLHSSFGGCETEVGPPPGDAGTEFPIPANPGECGDVQVFLFENVPA